MKHWFYWEIKRNKCAWIEMVLCQSIVSHVEEPIQNAYTLNWHVLMSQNWVILDLFYFMRHFQFVIPEVDSAAILHVNQLYIKLLCCKWRGRLLHEGFDKNCYLIWENPCNHSPAVLLFVNKTYYWNIWKEQQMSSFWCTRSKQTCNIIKTTVPFNQQP